LWLPRLLTSLIGLQNHRRPRGYSSSGTTLLLRPQQLTQFFIFELKRHCRRGRRHRNTGGPFDYYPATEIMSDLNGRGLERSKRPALVEKRFFGGAPNTLTFPVLAKPVGAGRRDLQIQKTTVVTLGDFTESKNLATECGFHRAPQTSPSPRREGDLVFTSVAGGNPNVGNILDKYRFRPSPRRPTVDQLMLIWIRRAWAGQVSPHRKCSLPPTPCMKQYFHRLKSIHRGVLCWYRCSATR